MALYFVANYLSRFVFWPNLGSHHMVGIPNTCMTISELGMALGQHVIPQYRVCQLHRLDPCHFQSGLNFTNFTCKLVETKPHNYTFLLFTWLPKFAKLRLIRKTNAIVEMTPTNKHTTLLQSRAKAVTKYERPKKKKMPDKNAVFFMQSFS